MQSPLSCIHFFFQMSDEMKWFLLHFRDDDSFQILPQELIKMSGGIVDWGPSDWINSTDQQIQVHADLEAGLTIGTVIQVAWNDSDLKDSLKKAATFRFDKKQKLVVILSYFKRFKSGRDRVPPLNRVLTETESSDLDLPVTDEPKQHDKTELQPPHHDLELLPPPTKKCQLGSSARPMSPATPIRREVRPSQRSNRCSTGQYGIDVESYLDTVRDKGIDPYSPTGHSHLLMMTLSEVVKLRSLIMTSRISHNEVELPLRPKELGLPLHDKSSYEIFKQKLELEEGFKENVVRFLKRLGGPNVDGMVTRMINSLLTKEFQTHFNKTGRDYAKIGRPLTGKKIPFTGVIEPLIQGEFSYTFIFFRLRFEPRSKCSKLLKLVYNNAFTFILRFSYTCNSLRLLKLAEVMLTVKCTESEVSNRVERYLKDAAQRLHKRSQPQAAASTSSNRMQSSSKEEEEEVSFFP